MSAPRQLSKILNLANLETNTITANIDSDIVNQTVTLGVTLPVGTISVSSADTLPLSNIPIGQQGFVTTTNKLYIYNGSGWYNIATINSTPYWVTEANASYTLNTNGTATVVEINAADSDGTTVSYTATGDSNFNAIATVVQDSDGRFVIRSIDSDGSVSKTSTSGTLTFTATDGVDQASTASTFSINFGPDWSVAPTEVTLYSDDQLLGDSLGMTVAINGTGDYIATSAYRHGVETGGGSPSGGYYDGGAFYVFNKSGGTWSQLDKITPTNGTGGLGIGFTSISDDGNYFMSGQTEDDNGGSVLIWSKSSGTWSEQKIQPPVTTNNVSFGHSGKLSGDSNYVIVGDPFYDSQKGMAWIFSRSGSTWTQQTLLTPSDYNIWMSGSSVSINIDATYAVVGAERHNVVIDSNNPSHDFNSGGVYVWTRSGSTWTQQTTLHASVKQSSQFMGTSVDINDDATYIITGAYSYDISGGAANVGGAYIFTRSGSTWTQQTILTPSDAAAGDGFGRAVAISGDGKYAVVGARTKPSATRVGAAYVFERSGSTWTQVEKIVGTHAINNSEFGGFSVSISDDGSTVTIGGGATGATVDGLDSRVYIYEA